MIARRTRWLTLAAMAVMAAASACTREGGTPAAKAGGAREFELGANRVRVTLPTGWDALDQGQRKRFRQGEFEIVLESLGPSTSLRSEPSTSIRPEPAVVPARDFDELIDRGLAALGHDQRRDVKERFPATIDGREAMDIETWHRLDHTNPQRILLVSADGDLLALHTERMANAESLKVFDSMRASFHFVSARR